jgi:uncharacterized protein YcbX
MKLVTNLYIYPIKSLGGIEISVVNVTSRGLEFDRRWMLVDEHNQFLTQRNFPRLAQLRTSIQDKDLLVQDLSEPSRSVRFPLVPVGGETIRVTVWDDDCDAWDVDGSVNVWFSRILERNVKLVFMPDESLRPVDPRYAVKNDITSFSDAYPILLIGQSSLDDLNARLESPVPMARFRPNIVFSGGAPYAEDDMHRFSINGIDFHGVKLCARCVMTTIDQDKAVAGKEPLRTLSQYRTIDNKVMFGQNVLVGGAGSINVGDVILES